MSKRININLSDKAYEQLEDLAKTRGKNMSETIRDALALAIWAEGTSAAGGRLLVERKGKSPREVVLR